MSLFLSACGGGGNENKTDQVVVAPVVPDQENVTTSDELGEKLTRLNQFKVLDVGSELQAQDFGLAAWNPTAMVLDGDILYVANSQTESQILRYDLKQKRALTAINPVNVTGLAKTWNSLEDLEIHAGRLYVANYASNRIDILDVSADQPQFIMALGTGSWRGDNHNYAIVHSNAVTADDRFVYAPDIHGRINVWQQKDVIAGNHLKAKKYARLSLPNCARNCNARMEVIGNRLYTSLPNGITYVHDIESITENANNVMPILTQSGLSTVLHHHDGLLYASRNNGTVETYQADLLNQSSILPSAVVDKFSHYILKNTEQHTALPKASDLAIHDKKLLHLANQGIRVLPMLSLQQNQSNLNSQALSMLEANAVSQTRMLQDRESWETLTNVNQRQVFMNQILSASIHGDSLTVQSYSAVPVRDLQIRAKIKNSYQWVVVAHLDQITPFATVKYKLQLNDRSRFPLVDGRGSIQLAGLNQASQIPTGIFDLKITSETDPHVKKLEQIKAKWRLTFGKYNEPGKWCPITPVYARE